MCKLCADMLKGKITIPEAKKKLYKIADIEPNKKKKLHYQQLLGNMEKAYDRVFKKNKKPVFKEEDSEVQSTDRQN